MRKVLVLDHSLTVRMDLDEAFRAAGWSTVLCASVAAAREALRQGPTDAIVLDLVLPDASGFDLLGELRANPALAGVPVLLLSSEEEVAGEMEQLRIAADEYVGKPYERADVVSRAQRLTQARRRPSLTAPPGLVLAIDDSPTYLNELGALLRGDGHEVIQAQSGSEALEVLAVRSPDCILLDMLMPQISGEQLCRRIKDTPAWRPIPVIMLTGRDDEAAILESFNAGADDYVAKSSDFTVLRARLNAQLRRRHLEREALRIQDELHRRDVEVAEAKATIAERTRVEKELRAAKISAERAKAAAEEVAEQLRASQARQEAANKELDAFAYSVSHDLRAPLRAMDAFSRILLEQHASKMDADAQHCLQMIRDNAKEMGCLIDDLLAFSRLSQQPLRKERIDQSALVRAVIQSLQSEQQGRRIQISIDELPAAEADPRLLMQVWVNLIANAFKYTRSRDEAVIRIGSRIQEAVPVYYVQDNGVGFDMRYAHKLFNVFQRLHRAEEYEGTGVGLSIVRRIIDRHGGRIWTQAAKNEGAAFYFTLEGNHKHAQQ